MSGEDTRAASDTVRDWDTASAPALVVIVPLQGEEAPLGDVIEAMMPAVDVPSPVEALQARRNADARWRTLQEFGALTASQVADLAGSTAKNRSSLVGHWLRDGAVFAVTHNGTRYFPAFQFDDSGRPRDVISTIVADLADVGEWQRALWFTTRTSLLDDRRPVDLLDAEPDAVVRAARMDAELVD